MLLKGENVPCLGENTRLEGIDSGQLSPLSKSGVWKDKAPPIITKDVEPWDCWSTTVYEG